MKRKKSNQPESDSKRRKPNNTAKFTIFVENLNNIIKFEPLYKVPKKYYSTIKEICASDTGIPPFVGLDFIKTNFPNLESLSFSGGSISDGSINESLEGLPESIKKLSLSYCDFNQPLDKMIFYNKEYNGVNYGIYDRVSILPEGLEDLIIHCLNFNQSVNNLPKGLTTLSIRSSAFNHPIDRLPNLKNLNICSRVFDKSLDNLPDTIEHLSLTWCKKLDFKTLNNLPKGLKIFSIHGFADQINDLNFIGLPKGLDKIRIYGYSDINSVKLHNLPKDCKIVTRIFDNDDWD